MAFGDFARLDDYNPNAAFPALPEEDEATWARERAAAALARGVRRPSETSQETIDKLAGVASDLLIPKTPLDVGLTLATLPAGPLARPAVRAGALALGGLLQSDEAQAEGVVGKGVKAAKNAIGSLLRPGYLSAEDQTLFAQRYPQAGATELKIDKSKKPPKQYESKTWTAEEERLAAARERVVADMKAEPWVPYFDPAKRYDVDYAEYMRLFGQPADTRALRMSDPKAAAKHSAVAEGEDAQAALGKAFETGKSLPGAEGFYKMGQLESEFIDALGPDEGRRQFVRMFTEPMAATTGGSTPTSNLIQSGFANYMREKGLPLPLERAADIPYPVGGSKYGARQNLQQYDNMLNQGGGGIAHTEHPKRYDFDWSFRGRRDAPVIDEQMMGMLTGGTKAVPPTGGYGLYAEGVHKAAKGKVDPIEYQEIGWAGHKRDKEITELMRRGRSKEEAEAMAFQGQPMITDVNEAIERTSRLLQIPPKEVVRRGLVSGKLPIYGVGGTAALGSLADQSNYR